MQIKQAGMAVLLVGLGVGGAFAHGGASGVVKKRMDAMETIGGNMKSIAKMLRGGSHEPGKIALAANTIASHAGDALTVLFPEGSLKTPSEASPAIWTDWPQFEIHAGDLRTAALKLKDLAQDGAERQNLSSAFDALSRTCKSCHKAFRVKK
ncbi:c-type cytochrome [Roseibium sp. M-1]